MFHCYKVVVQRLMADGSADAPIPLERRYSHLKTFHGGWLAPVVSNAVPVNCPHNTFAYGKL